MKIVVGALPAVPVILYARVVAHHLPSQIRRKLIIVQYARWRIHNCRQNYVYSVAKPDGLTLGAFTAPVYFAQLLGRKKVQFDWANSPLDRDAGGERRVVFFDRISPTRRCSIS